MFTFYASSLHNDVFYIEKAMHQNVRFRGNAMSSGKNKTARQSRIRTLVDKWRMDFVEYSSNELHEIQEVIEYILDERFYSKGR